MKYEQRIKELNAEIEQLLTPPFTAPGIPIWLAQNKIKLRDALERDLAKVVAQRRGYDQLGIDEIERLEELVRNLQWVEAREAARKAAAAAGVDIDKVLNDDLLDKIQLGLDIVGVVVPFGGDLLDVANAGISLYRGNYADAALSLAGANPFGGQFIGGLKIGKKLAAAAGVAVGGGGTVLGIVVVKKVAQQAEKNADKLDEAAEAAAEAAKKLLAPKGIGEVLESSTKSWKDHGFRLFGDLKNEFGLDLPFKYKDPNVKALVAKEYQKLIENGTLKYLGFADDTHGSFHVYEHAGNLYLFGKDGSLISRWAAGSQGRAVARIKKALGL